VETQKIDGTLDITFQARRRGGRPRVTGPRASGRPLEIEARFGVARRATEARKFVSD